MVWIVPLLLLQAQIVAAEERPSADQLVKQEPAISLADAVGIANVFVRDHVIAGRPADWPVVAEVPYRVTESDYKPADAWWVFYRYRQVMKPPHVLIEVSKTTGQAREVPLE